MDDDGAKTRPRRRRRQPRPSPSPEALATQALLHLRRLGRVLAEQHGVAHGEPLPIDHLMLPVRVPLGGQGDDIDPADAQALVRELGGRVGEGLKALVAFQPGRVYCFQCESADCVHARPPDRTATFSGYTPTGKPEWQTLTNLCIARHDPRVDRLFGEHPEIIALVQTANDLKGGLLPGFGHGSLAFNVLGQVVAGLIPEDLYESDEQADHRVTITFQVVETRTGHATRRLRLNVLGITPGDIATAAADGEDRGPAESLRRTVRSMRHRLDSLGRRAFSAERRGETPHLEADVEPLLFRLRGDIERIFRPLQRRTRHAQDRHLDGARPTSRAMSDALAAPDERVLEDAERKTIVVLGPKGRAHIFSPAGKHVTSMQLRPGELDRKSGRARWRAMPREDVTAFRARLRPQD